MGRTKQTDKRGPSKITRVQALKAVQEGHGLKTQRKRQRKQATPKRRRNNLAWYNGKDGIKKYMNSTDTMISKTAFQRVVKEIMQAYNSELRIQSLALLALQQSGEEHIVQWFRDAYVAVMENTKRVTLMKEDLIFVKQIRQKRQPQTFLPTEGKKPVRHSLHHYTG